MLLGTQDWWAYRRTAVDGNPTLASLADWLAARLDVAPRGPVFIPDRKAALTSDGGVCEIDGARFAFDPFSPERHICPVCDAVYRGERHELAWIWRYHLWLSERAIHAALLHRLGRAAWGNRWADAVIRGYVERYAGYPNKDNVLGPTRPFFSTYLESIWLLQLIVAADFLRATNPDMPGAGFDDMVAESASLIESYHEGRSNRQVWNTTAVLAAGRWLGETDMIERSLARVRRLLRDAVARSGWWYEGENYHLFALRGFVFAAELLQGAGFDLYDSDPRLAQMFVAPLTTLLPDLTLPARGDAPYGVSVQQPRFAELWEIGWARTGSERLEAVLHRLYGEPGAAIDLPAGEIAELEQNRPAGAVSRSRLGWKALAWMNETEPRAASSPFREGHDAIEPHGPAIVRTRTDSYVSLETATHGHGHGHPDALSLTLYDGRLWLGDFGTGSYVTRSLHWYRSSLAHSAPAIAGVGQGEGMVRSVGGDVTKGIGWMRATGGGLLGPGSNVTRTVVSVDHLIVDVVECECPSDVMVELPLHLLGEFEFDTTPPDDLRADEPPATPIPSGHDAATWLGRIPAGPVALAVRVGDERLHVRLPERSGEAVYVLEAPGPPDLALADGVQLPFLVRRANGSGRWVQVFSTGVELEDVRLHDDEIVVACAGGPIHVRTTAREVHVVRPGPDVMTATVSQPRMAMTRASAQEHRTPLPRVSVECRLHERAPDVDSDPTEFMDLVTLGADHYRRSEPEYPGPDRFSAKVGCCASGSRLYFFADVVKPDPVFRGARAPDPRLDNDPPDIHSDGVQCHFGLTAWGGFLAIPVPGGADLRVATTTVGVDRKRCGGQWRKTEAGYRVLAWYDARRPFQRGDELRVNIVINEMLEGRVRRAGQLALSGGGGWVYLRGDRERHDTAAMAVIA